HRRWSGPTGAITGSLVKSLVDDLPEPVFYVVAPRAWCKPCNRCCCTTQAPTTTLSVAKNSTVTEANIMPSTALSLQTTDSQQPTDVELAMRASAGDELAFECIMRRHNRLLFRTARSILKNDDETEDALQEAYLRAWRALGSFRADARL